MAGNPVSLHAALAFKYALSANVAPVSSTSCNCAVETSTPSGFGYDPIFLVGEQSFGQLSDDEKDRISHRGKALMLFSQKLQEYLNN